MSALDQRWLERVKRLQALAATGLHYTDGEYDRERYEEINQITILMLAELAEVPVERIEGLVPTSASGYATPLIDVRSAVLQDDTILLVREATDGRWTLPGGFADIGHSAARNAEKEVAEEASINVSARSIYAVRHKSKHAYDPDVRDFYKVFFLCEAIDGTPPRPGPETTDARYFPRGEWPELSRGRVIEQDLEAAFLHAETGRLWFD